MIYEFPTVTNGYSPLTDYLLLIWRNITARTKLFLYTIKFAMHLYEKPYLTVK